MAPDPANHGELPPNTARWGDIESDGRLHIPTDVLAALGWYSPGKRCDVVLELLDRGCVRIHEGTARDNLAAKRSQLLKEYPNRTEALRRIAVSHAIFLEGAIGQSNRRITLSTAVIAHLAVEKPARVLCLAYAEWLEIMSEEKAQSVIEAVRIDINVET